uniref:methylated-DNA--[protein]-cysteine S-methyltransferase n=1 Tax=Ningiella ruwaisensis TaxID=2364274 RepID=UPI0010A0BB63|nr:methylated-DNA--[protein]-cysteine S-methyltransferase [Ningiella ruwaisensis]
MHANLSFKDSSSIHDDFIATIFTSRLKTPLGPLEIVATESAVTTVRFIDEEADNSSIDNGATKENALSICAKQQLKEYFDKKRKHFDLPLSPLGTEFQQNVWKHLLKVEYGTTASYLDVAKAINKPKACRAVGAANGKNPIAIIVPCHRIIGASGMLTGYAGGLARKAYLLKLETL